MRWSVFLLVLIGCGGPDPEAGAATFATNCVPCHGASGDQGTEVSGTPAADLNEAVPALSDDELADVIQNGKGAMPATTVSDDEIDDLIAYLRETFGG